MNDNAKNMQNNVPYVVYWLSKRGRKWTVCSTIDKAKRLKVNLEKQGCFCWVALDIPEFGYKG